MLYNKLDNTTRKWWFYTLFIALQFLIPPFASHNFSFNNWGDMVSHTLSHSFSMDIRHIYPYGQYVLIAFLLCWLIFGNKIKQIINILIALSVLLFMLIQNIAITEKYGFSMVTLNIILFLMVALVWFYDLKEQKNTFSPPKPMVLHIILILAVVFTLWTPVHWNPISPDFSPNNFFINGSAFQFCMMIPLYLSMLLFSFPKVNLVTLRITGLVGLTIGQYNLAFYFIFIPEMWWMGIMHLPLFLISLYAFFKSFKLPQAAPLQASSLKNDAEK